MEKSAKKRFLYSHEYRDQKWGENPAKQFFRNKPIVPAKKCSDKNRRKKLRKKVFYIHTNIVTKNRRKKRAKQFLQEHTNNARNICWGKKIVGKKCENTFLYSHEYRDQKMGKKNARNNFSRNTPIVRAKNVTKKIVVKKCEKTFFIITRIS